ncbi:MAG: tetratricopeptide repeat protein [Oscillospiraceae bacterium]|nr:tetratricopeptide repeat protein [Oscillospiraceae bacterium]
MRDPYEVLGVPPDASDDDVKAAHRELTKKYHSSNYATSPLSDLAQNKLKEADVAYNEIIERRADSHLEELFDIRYDIADTGRSAYPQIRTALYSGELDTAEKLLAAEQNRGAEWHFLMGRFNYKKGWLDQARQHFEKAVELEPNNREYQRALLHMEEGGTLSEHDKGKRRGECCEYCDCGCDCGCCDCCDGCGCDCG